MARITQVGKTTKVVRSTKAAAKTKKVAAKTPVVTKPPKTVKGKFFYVYTLSLLTVDPVPRKDAIYTCSACPTSDVNQFDRLSDTGGHNRKRSLEYHVKEAHPNHTGDFKELKGTPFYKERMTK